MEDDKNTLTGQPDSKTQDIPAAARTVAEPEWVHPDLEFIQQLNKLSGNRMVRCFQCGTCSATCVNSPDLSPFPRKEMAWANWGIKDRLLSNVDIWICYNCNNCSTRCPRDARPGDVLAAVRQLSVQHFSFPRFLGSWVSQPQSLLLLIGLPALLLTLALVYKDDLGRLLGFAPDMSQRLVYSYSSVFPHWLLNGFFFILTGLIVIVSAVGAVRFWRAIKKASPPVNNQPSKSILSSIGAVFSEVIMHKSFSVCITERTRYISHMCVFFGFAALTMVTLWIITLGINPFIRDSFVYPYSFFNPWKILANLGGLAILFGCSLMIRDRLKEKSHVGVGTYFDWAFIVMILAAVLTGFFTEVLHYLRLEPHRHIVYFFHLVSVCTLLMYLPYSKFAHIIYRTTALIYAEYSGRTGVSADLVEIPDITGGEKS